MLRIPRITFETVDFDTPACRATSRIVGGLPAGGSLSIKLRRSWVRSVRRGLGSLRQGARHWTSDAVPRGAPHAAPSRLSWRRRSVPARSLAAPAPAAGDGSRSDRKAGGRDLPP